VYILLINTCTNFH